MADATSLSRHRGSGGGSRRLYPAEDTEKALETIEPTKLLGVVVNEACSLPVDYDQYHKATGRYSKSTKHMTSHESDQVKVATV